MNAEQLEAMREGRRDAMEAMQRRRDIYISRRTEGVWPSIIGIFMGLIFAGLLIRGSANDPSLMPEAIEAKKFQQCLASWPLAECQARKDAGAL